MNIDEIARAYEQLKSERRCLSVDLRRADLNPDRGEFEKEVQQLVAAAIGHESPDRYRLLWKALLVRAGELFAWSPPEAAVRRVSQCPSEIPAVRHATRVLAMIHELHKAGYQRIRGLPYLAPSGMYWRCAITYSDNVRDDGYGIIDEDTERKLVANYTSGQGSKYFDWPDAEGLSARELAERFLARFPLIAERGQGRDWAYAGWWTDVLGRAEQGTTEDLLYLIADWPLDESILRDWQPPPPLR